MMKILRRVNHCQKRSDGCISCFVIFTWLFILILVLFMIRSSVERESDLKFENQQNVKLIQMIQTFLR